MNKITSAMYKTDESRHKPDTALFILNVSDLYLWPQGRTLYWLYSVQMVSEAISITLDLVPLLQILKMGTCSRLIIVIPD